ncbi:hypothetical protein CO153_02960 [Candidatus Pacearchaeota archaeon CG_4_9_14_3_um_filter_30_11]|nr:MAG: hypothetical protein COV77_00960 [Candidatus Pacearchaeota archaeon CG11_big_fil_rev_8_21_14_0_20_30_13]PJA71181.1 MAG: hypothetical protein CO153_02960 [Candidatus Pacearchaeota archaeon CG_4_9_14_3_um_filter_30_11]
MKKFEFYLNEKVVKKVSSDPSLANFLLADAKERFSQSIKLKLKEFNKIIFENVYDSLRNILDALLAINGFKSYSHEASIAFLQKFNIEESIILELDNFRYQRNSSKYYGKNISLESTTEIINFYNKYSEKLIKLCKKKDNCAKK